MSDKTTDRNAQLSSIGAATVGGAATSGALAKWLMPASPKLLHDAKDAVKAEHIGKGTRRYGGMIAQQLLDSIKNKGNRRIALEAGLGGLAGGTIASLFPGDESSTTRQRAGNGFQLGGGAAALAAVMSKARGGRNAAIAGTLAALVGGALPVHQPKIEKTASVGNVAAGLFKGYVIPRLGLFKNQALANIKRVPGMFSKTPQQTWSQVNQPFASRYSALQRRFGKLGMGSQIGYGAAKALALTPLGMAGTGIGQTFGAGAMSGVASGASGYVDDLRNQEVGKALHTTRNYVHQFLNDPAQRMKLGLGALFSPGAVGEQADDLLAGLSRQLVSRPVGR